MANRLFEFYIDESGSFQDDEPARMRYPQEQSLVGGILYELQNLSEERVLELLPHKVHCCKQYNKSYLDVLEALCADGAHLVIFENKERIKVVNGDITYLNIISEGLVQLLSYLPLEYPNDHIKVRIVVATRKAMASGSGIIRYNEYETRLTQKLFIAIHRSKKTLCEYELSFADARYSKRHDIADIVCNTYLTRNRKHKFTDEERARINAVFDSRFIFSVFEDATAGYLKQLLSEGRFGEMMYQLCTMIKLQGLTDLRNKLLVQLIKSSSVERKAFFQYISLQIGLYNNRRMYAEGIRFAENFKKYILYHLLDASEIKKEEIDFWIFDTDFFILTMYDHIGNASMCEKYLNQCRSNIHSINHSWEHIDYYFKFRIRELNCLLGRFDFDAVIEKSAKLIDIFTSAKELFGMIETYDGTTNRLPSELLGKTYGVQLEAYINKLPLHPDLFDKALQASDQALAEFSSPSDLQRQYQYRCSLMVVAGKPDEALDSLLKSYELKQGEAVFQSFVQHAYSKKTSPDAFALWHYTNVMLALGQAGNPSGMAMFKALTGYQSFVEDVKNPDKGGYPWNMILWNMSRWYRLTGSPSVADTYYHHALSITKEHPEQITLYSFSISMVADYLKWNLAKGKMTTAQAKNALFKALSHFNKCEMPESMRLHFSSNSNLDLKAYVDYLCQACLK